MVGVTRAPTYGGPHQTKEISVKLKFVLLSLILSLMGQIGRADPMAVHGMFVFGERDTYLSHLPMFHAPHDYQVILKVSFQSSHTNHIYQRLNHTTDSTFTLVPQPMDLTEVIAGTKTSFTADLYDGHFERGGKKLGSLVVDIEKIIVAAKLDADRVHPEDTRFIAFGERGEYFVAHLIDGKPSFDFIANSNQPIIFDNFSGCRTRICKPEDQGPFRDLVLDSTLPVVISQPATSQTSEVPANNSRIGANPATTSYGYFVDLQDVIYVEEEELSH